MKKTNRKLIPAVAMLLVSAIMLSTSSFAWFSMNKTATATGMEVQATADTSLVISLQESTGFQASVALEGATKTTMLPVSAVGINADETLDAQYKDHNVEGFDLGALNLGFMLIGSNNEVKDPANHAATTPLSTKIGQIDTITQMTESGLFKQDNLTNVATDDVYLKVGSGSEAGPVDVSLTVKVTPAGGQKDIDKAMHVGVLVGKNFKVIDMSQASWKSDHYEITVADVISLTVNKSTGDKVGLYAWYEGEDAQCMTNNATVNNQAIVFEFTAP